MADNTTNSSGKNVGTIPNTADTVKKDTKPITWKCYRIQNVPYTWTKSKLHLSLQKLESLGDLKESELSLFSTSSSSLIKTALMYREKSPECFRSLGSEKTILLEVDVAGTDGVAFGSRHFLSVDCEFYGLTPLNDPVGDNIVDVIAVTGLAGNAYGSWTNRRTRHMWLKDFLPREHKNIRVLTYGYNTKLMGEGKVNFSLVDHNNTFIQQLENVRISEEEKKRPIIFIGHSFGGILILQGLVESRYSLQRDIVHSTHGLLLFGVPLLGLNGVEELEAMVNDMPPAERPSKHELINCLKKDSQYLKTLNPKIIDLCSKLQLHIFSYYEKILTRTAQKNPTTGKWERSGREVLSVDMSSAVMALPNEKRYPIPLNHTEMVKFETMGDSNYRTVSTHIAECLQRISRMRSTRKRPNSDEDERTDKGNKILKDWKVLTDILDAPQNPAFTSEIAIGKAIRGDQELEFPYSIPMKLPFQRNSNFTGRKKELDAIQDLLQGIDHDADSPEQRVVALHGLGGIGKTQIAIQYAYSHEKDYTSIWWVSGATTETLSQGFLQIARDLVAHHAQGRPKAEYSRVAIALGIPPDAVSQKGKIEFDLMRDTINGVKSWLAAKDNQKWLLIIDNYDDMENVMIADFLPASGSIIVTSRASASEYLGEGLEIVEIELEDAIEILRKSARRKVTTFDNGKRGILVRHEDVFFDLLPLYHEHFITTSIERDDALAIVKKLGALPLALDQAGSYIKTQQITFGDYLPIFEKEFTKVAAQRRPKAVWQYREDTLFTTWEISFNTLGSDAQHLLLLCGFLDNEDIWQGLLPPEKLKELGIGSVTEAVLDIFSLSLAKRKTSDGLWIHPMVHLWSQERLGDSAKQKNASDAISLTAAATWFDESSRTANNWVLERRLMPHIQVCFNHTCVHHYIEEATISTLSDLQTLARVLIQQADFRKAEELLRWVLVGNEASLGKNHPDTLNTVHLMASIFNTKGEYNQALEFYKRAFSGRVEVLGGDHPDTLTTIHEVASVFNSQGKHARALQWYEGVLARREKVLGMEHPDTLATIHNIAGVFNDQGEYEKALEWYSRSLSAGEKTLGMDHPDTLATVISMASVFKQLGRNSDEDVFALYKRGLDGSERVLGKDHPDTLIAVNNMASAFVDQGKHEEALELYRRALDGNDKALGKDHRNTLGTIQNMASVFQKQRKLDDALEWYKRALVGRVKVLGRGHEETLHTIHDMASVYEEQGKDNYALEWYRGALAGRESTLGIDHVDTLKTIHGIASVLDNQGKYNEALEWYKKVLTGREKLLPMDHPDTLSTMHDIANVLENQEKFDDALELYRRALAGSEKVLGSNHPDTLSTLHNIASVLESQGEDEEALALYQRVLAGKKKTLGENHIDTLDAMHSVASMLEEQGKYDDALELYKPVLREREKSLGTDHPDTLITVFNMASILEYQGKHDDAREWFRRVIASRDKALTGNHIFTPSMKTSLTLLKSIHISVEDEMSL